MKLGSFVRVLKVLVISAFFIGSASAEGKVLDFETMRENMVETQLKARGIEDAGVLKAMSETERHHFVPKAIEREAYTDRPLPIGYEQTISQPFIVALMTEKLKPKPEDKILEIGTGSGYQAAVLSSLARKVFTIEIVEPLGRQASQTLKELGYANVTVKVGDGYRGWPEEAPFDGIIVTAAPDHIPQPLIDQLAPGGRMLIPVGKEGGIQQLTLLEKDEDGLIHRESIELVRFVPLTRD